MTKPVKIILGIIVAAAVIGGIMWFAYLRQANGPAEPLKEQLSPQEESEEVAASPEEVSEEQPKGEVEGVEWSGDDIENELGLLGEF